MRTKIIFLFLLMLNSLITFAGDISHGNSTLPGSKIETVIGEFFDNENIIYEKSGTSYQHESVFVPLDDLLLPGYARKISGTDFIYGSAIPGLREAMIVRATDGNWSMEWETAEVPRKADNHYVSFVWAANLNNVSGRIPMSMYFNDNKEIQFYLSGKTSWREDAGNGISLSFIMSERDGGDDFYGFMVLRVPASEIRFGRAQQIRVVGGEANSNAWYMTMKKSLGQGFTIKSLPAITSENDRHEQLLELAVLYFGKATEASFQIGEVSHSINVGFGYNRTILHYPLVEEETVADVHLGTAGFEQDGRATISPVRRMEVKFVQATHTDIGYTRPQHEILGEHLRYIDYALDYCDATDHYPEAAQFRWVCEVTWPVNEYLRSRPEWQIERLKRRIDEGRIEVAGMYVNYDELPDEQSLAASMAPIKNIQSHGIEVKSAVQNDVNGIAWAFNDYFNSVGIKYLNMGTHGHKALLSFDRPTAFWWESPSGNRILAFRAEHYHIGNVRFHISRQNFEFFERQLLEYLEELVEKGYPFDVVMIQHSGYLTDNSPPSILPLEMIKKWNEKYEWPKLRSALFRDFFERMEESYADQLPVYRAAWPDWWTDGFGSGAREVAAVRQAHVDLIAGQGALAMAQMMGSGMPEDLNSRIHEANDALLFYGEHTFGAAQSISAPFSSETLEMRRLKESYAWDASRRARMVQEEALGLLQGYVSGEDEMSLAVFNTLPWQRNGYVTVFLDHERVPRGNSLTLHDLEGGTHTAQLDRHIHGGSYWNVRVDHIPAFGYRKFVLDVSADRHVPQALPEARDNIYENQWYRIGIDKDKGVVSSIWDKDIKAELVDKDAEWGFGQFIYEMLADRDQVVQRPNEVPVEQLGLGYHERWALDSVWFDSFRAGGIWNTIRFRGKTRAAEPADAFSFEVRLFNNEKRIDFSYSINKRSVTGPESIYVAFPFKIEDYETYSDVPGGTFRAVDEQIPGSTNDWNTVQNFVAVRNGEKQVILGSNQAPLMQFGNINTGRFEYNAKPESSHIYGWPMNNYWITNFNANQYGEYTWTYYFTSGKDTGNATATRFGWESRIPFLTRVIPAGVKGIATESKKSILSDFPANVLMVNAIPGNGNNSILLHIRETGGEPVSFFPRSPVNSSLEITEANVLGQTAGREPSGEINLQPYESKFLEISW
jgi:alpha-mannosidase